MPVTNSASFPCVIVHWHVVRISPPSHVLAEPVIEEANTAVRRARAISSPLGIGSGVATVGDPLDLRCVEEHDRVGGGLVSLPVGPHFNEVALREDASVLLLASYSTTTVRGAAIPIRRNEVSQAACVDRTHFSSPAPGLRADAIPRDPVARVME
jgi:hypothetical protein